MDDETKIMADYIKDNGFEGDFEEYCDEMFNGVCSTQLTMYDKLVLFLDERNLGLDYEEYFDDVTGGAF